jgi:hypothetical protein
MLGPAVVAYAATLATLLLALMFELMLLVLVLTRLLVPWRAHAWPLEVAQFAQRNRWLELKFRRPTRIAAEGTRNAGFRTAGLNVRRTPFLIMLLVAIITSYNSRSVPIGVAAIAVPLGLAAGLLYTNAR